MGNESWNICAGPSIAVRREAGFDFFPGHVPRIRGGNGARVLIVSYGILLFPWAGTCLFSL